MNESTIRGWAPTLEGAASDTFRVAQQLSQPRRRHSMTKTARVYKIEMLIRNRGNVSFKTLLDELEVALQRERGVGACAVERRDEISETELGHL